MVILGAILAANTVYLFLIVMVVQEARISDQKKNACISGYLLFKYQKFVQRLSLSKKTKPFWSAVTETTPEHWGWHDWYIYVLMKYVAFLLQM